MNPQKPTISEELRNDLKAFQLEFRTLRDEVKLKLHLAGMDLKKEWEALEPQFDRALNSATVVSNEMVEDLKKRLAEFRQRLARH